MSYINLLNCQNISTNSVRHLCFIYSKDNYSKHFLYWINFFDFHYLRSWCWKFLPFLYFTNLNMKSSNATLFQVINCSTVVFFLSADKLYRIELWEYADVFIINFHLNYRKFSIYHKLHCLSRKYTTMEPCRTTLQKDSQFQRLIICALYEARIINHNKDDFKMNCMWHRGIRSIGNWNVIFSIERWLKFPSDKKNMIEINEDTKLKK